MSEDELHALMTAALAGDQAAYRRMLDLLSGGLRSFVRRRLFLDPDEAEDIVQEVLLAVHLKRHTYDRAQPVTAWVYAIARFKLIDHLRRLGRKGVHVPVDYVEGLAAEETVEAGVARRDIDRLLDRLPEKQKKSIRMVKLEDRSVREAAAAASMSESDVKVSIHRGLKALARMVMQEARNENG